MLSASLLQVSGGRQHWSSFTKATEGRIDWCWVPEVGWLMKASIPHTLVTCVSIVAYGWLILDANELGFMLVYTYMLIG